jgi:hypothetical protein
VNIHFQKLIDTFQVQLFLKTGKLGTAPPTHPEEVQKPMGKIRDVHLFQCDTCLQSSISDKFISNSLGQPCVDQ